ncbi:hypothetical protein, partial [Alistipes putredinis]
PYPCVPPPEALKHEAPEAEAPEAGPARPKFTPEAPRKPAPHARRRDIGNRPPGAECLERRHAGFAATHPAITRFSHGG